MRSLPTDDFELTVSDMYPEIYDGNFRVKSEQLALKMWLRWRIPIVLLLKS